MAGIGQVVLEARAAIVSYINSSFLAKFRFPVTREDVTMLKTFRQSQSYDSVRPSYLRQRDRGNYKESVACLITKASNSSHFHFPLIFCSLLAQPGSISIESRYHKDSNMFRRFNKVKPCSAELVLGWVAK